MQLATSTRLVLADEYSVYIIIIGFLYFRTATGACATSYAPPHEFSLAHTHDMVRTINGDTGLHAQLDIHAAY